MHFVGKNNKSTRIIYAYAPHQPTGPESVGSRHRSYFKSVGRDADPVDALWTDISRLVRKWTEAGEILVLLSDCNVDARGEKTQKYMADLGMRDVITEFHGDEGPRTHNRGSKPIDGIFMTQDLYIVQGVMLIDRRPGNTGRPIKLARLISVRTQM
jgi:hypothetical protein